MDVYLCEVPPFSSCIHTDVCYCSIASEYECLTLPFGSLHHLSSLPSPALSNCSPLPCTQFSLWAPCSSYSTWILNCGLSLTSTTSCLALSSFDSQWVLLPRFIYFSIYHQSFLNNFTLTVLYLNGNFLFPEHIKYSSLARRKNGRCFRFPEVVGRVGWSLSWNHGFLSFPEWLVDVGVMSSRLCKGIRKQGLHGWLSGWEHLLLFQRILVCFPAHTQMVAFNTVFQYQVYLLAFANLTQARVPGKGEPQLRNSLPWTGW